MHPIIPSLLDLVVPGTGHLATGRRRVGLLFLVPPVLLVATLVVALIVRGPIGLLEIAVTPGVLPALAIVNVALAAWRVAAGLDMARRLGWTRRTGAVVGVAILVLVAVPHLFVGTYIASVNDFLDSTFADVPDATDAPDETFPSSLAPTDTLAPSPAETTSPEATASDDVASGEPTSSAGTPRPAATPRPPMGSGTGTLPALGAAVPWTRPGAVPWGDDGRFDLLLLGSDAGIDRWSRRTDVMLLVEVDVATGKVAMIGLPRNLVNAPLPPGAARNASPCGCYQDLLNSLYVDATATHPDRWPGSGPTAGIGAVRAVISQLTGRPIDAVLVADLWGVIKVVDAMGGIDIDVPSAVHDDNYPDPVYGDIVLDIKAGKQHMDGRTALAYARSRHQDSDYGRMARQQTLLLAIRSQIDAGTILKAPSLLNAAKGFTWTDLPRSSLPNLIDLFSRAAHAQVRELRIAPSRYPAWLTPKEILQIQRDIADLLGTVPPPPPPTPTPSPSATPPPTASPTPAPTDTPSPTPSETPAETSASP